jgi:SAM-dependent methyltransferase
MAPRARLRLLTALTLLGALLLFGLEPLVGRLLLPAFGGSFAVWATCLMAFQGTLLAGYVYCHALAPRLGRWHLAVAATPLLFLPLALLPEHTPAPPLLRALGAAGVGLTEPDPYRPVLSMLRELLLGAVVPFGVLATTGVIAQAWLAASDLPEREDPYPLYAASNLGSLVALLGYPLLVEPFVSLRVQRVVWSVGYLLYLGLLVKAAPRAAAAPAPAAPATPPEAPEAPEADGPAPTWRDRLFWTGLAAAPSMFLVAVTNVISIDIGSMPLVWVVPLAVYLLSFVLVFRQASFYPPLLRRFWPEICVVGGYFFLSQSLHYSTLMTLAHLAVLFVVCIVGHGELHLSRPAPRHLSGFYLCLALGGFLGGAFVTLVAPRVFTSLAEYGVAIGLLGVTFVVGHARSLKAWIREEPAPLLAGSAVLCAIVGVRTVRALELARAPIHVHRDVYGIYKIGEVALDDAELASAGKLGLAPASARVVLRSTYHGTTLHGKQLQDDRLRRLPISYYHLRGPLGDVMSATRRRLGERPLRGAVIGLGAGTTAAYFRRTKGDAITFYELDPDVIDIARTYFTYLSDTERAGGQVRVVVGDARLELTRDQGAPADGYDVILVDAFSSDAIPVHLLTREAIEAFAGKLAPGGLLLYHISNRYYDLAPPLAATSRLLGLSMATKSRVVMSELAPFEDASDYVALARTPEALAPLLHPPETLDTHRPAWAPWIAAGPDLGARTTPWSDDFANLLGALRIFESD